jgi:3-carboxy-cis,cis-muconate cycloisomerase
VSSAPSSELLASLFVSSEAAAAFGDGARLQGMLDFEAALSRAEARTGVIPPSAAEGIARRCRAEQFNVTRLAEATVRAGNPAIPLIEALTALVAADDPEAARYVHWGATSQDAMDTGLVLQVRRFMTDLGVQLERLSVLLARLAEAHKNTLLAGRTLLQHAVPVTLGLKAAGWLDTIERHALRLEEIRSRDLVLQFGGAGGTLAALRGRGLEVARALAEELSLELPAVPWHAHRDRVVEVATFLGLLVGTLGKIARDLSLMMQTEVAEAFEPSGEGRGGSSTMPQKKNPIASAVALAASVRAPGLVATLLLAMVQEHERGLGGWHAEWQTLPELCSVAAGALRSMTEAIGGLELDPARMRRNLDETDGHIMAEAAAMALAERVGRAQAHEIVSRASRRAKEAGRRLEEVLGEDPVAIQHLSRKELGAIFEPLNYLGESAAFVDRVLAARRRREAH